MPHDRAIGRYDLYERAVQSVENDIDLIEHFFVARTGRSPLTLREDFCGSAALSRAWVQSDEERHATAVDLDEEVLGYAEARRGELHDEDRERLVLVRSDVRKAGGCGHDVITAMNFSWAVLADRALLEYLSSARSSLTDDGMLVLEMFGGPDLRLPGVDEHVAEGLVYRFERRAFDEASRRLEARLHFRCAGRELRDAFVYSFVLRSFDEVRAIARSAGLDGCDLVLEDRKGRYRRVRGRPRAKLFRALLLLGAS